jgi:hypothetical protein
MQKFMGAISSSSVLDAVKKGTIADLRATIPPELLSRFDEKANYIQGRISECERAINELLGSADFADRKGTASVVFSKYPSIARMLLKIIFDSKFTPKDFRGLIIKCI